MYGTTPSTLRHRREGTINAERRRHGVLSGRDRVGTGDVGTELVEAPAQWAAPGSAQAGKAEVSAESRQDEPGRWVNRSGSQKTAWRSPRGDY